MAQEAAAAIRDRTGVDVHDVAVILGSGWVPAVAALGDPVAVVPMAELPGFTPPTATGHGGNVAGVEQALENDPPVVHGPVLGQVDPSQSAVGEAPDDLVLAAALVEIDLHQIVDRLGGGGVVEAPFAHL